MNRQETIQQLLRDLEAADDQREQRRIRRELRKLGYYVSRHGKLIAGLVLAKRDGPPHVVTTLRLDGDLHRRLQLLAADEGKSANAIVEELVRKHLDQLGIPPRLKRER